MNNKYKIILFLIIVILVTFNFFISNNALESQVNNSSSLLEKARDIRSEGIKEKDCGKINEATVYIKKFIELHPDSAEAYVELGRTYTIMTTGEKDINLKSAIKYFKKAIKCNNDYADAYMELGNIYRFKGMKEEAEEAWKNAQELDPNMIVFGKDKKDIKQKVMYKQIIETIETNIFLKALRYYKQNKFEDAEEQLWIVVEIGNSESKISAYNLLGNIYLQQNNEKKAEEIYKKALELEPNNADLCYSIGRLYYYQNRYKEAIEYFDRALKIAPESWQAQISKNMINWSKRDLEISKVSEKYDEQLKEYERLTSEFNGLSKEITQNAYKYSSELIEKVVNFADLYLPYFNIETEGLTVEEINRRMAVSLRKIKESNFELERNELLLKMKEQTNENQ
ncbi:MAG: tetratricopeptide repeat protein [Candidatus Kappaea frigidicola]|nr:tetratricopeptide repeat protein [Candidatus Kappaea frigidicola]